MANPSIFHLSLGHPVTELWAGQAFVSCQWAVGSDVQGGPCQKGRNDSRGLVHLLLSQLLATDKCTNLFARDSSIRHFCTFFCLTNIVSSYRAKSTFCALSERSKNILQTSQIPIELLHNFGNYWWLWNFLLRTGVKESRIRPSALLILQKSFFYKFHPVKTLTFFSEVIFYKLLFYENRK